MSNWEKFVVPDWVVEDRNRRLNNSDTDHYSDNMSMSSAEFMKKLEERALERERNKSKNSLKVEEFVCSVICILILTVVIHMILF